MKNLFLITVDVAHFKAGDLVQLTSPSGYPHTERDTEVLMQDQWPDVIIAKLEATARYETIYRLPHKRLLIPTLERITRVVFR